MKKNYKFLISQFHNEEVVISADSDDEANIKIQDYVSKNRSKVPLDIDISEEENEKEIKPSSEMFDASEDGE